MRALIFIVLGLSQIVATTQDMTVPEIIKKHGYPCEIHTTTTSDGYILTLHRIPSGKDLKTFPLYTSGQVVQVTQRRQPVILQHGLLSSSGSWTIDLPYKTPAFIMADAGYDIWLPNVRGNFYSRNHTHLSPDSKEFWQFSWDEMAKQDLISFIDYVLKTTSYDQLYYVGHSMGTTIYFAGMSLYPSYNSKIKAMFALGPAATVSHIRSPVRYLAYASRFIMDIMETFNYYEFLPKNSSAMKVIGVFCKIYHISEEICENFIFLLTGFDKREFNETWIASAEEELSSGTSIYTIFHFAQEYISGKFQYFDFGVEENRRRYHQDTPPLYDVSKVTSPVYLIWGQNDYLADKEDVQFLINHLPNIRAKKPVPYPYFNHLDFLWAKDLKKLVYDPILQAMKEIDNEY